MRHYRSGPWDRLHPLSSTIFVTGLVAITFSATLTPTFADDAMRGRALAEQHCSDCHAIGRHDESPTRVNENTAFRDLHKRFPIEMLLKAAKSGTVEGHDEMPAFVFEPQDMKALLVYIDTLAPEGARRYVNEAGR